MAVITGMRVAIAVSVIVHVALIAWVQLHPEPARPVTRAMPTPAVPASDAPPDPEPMVVALLDDHSVPTASIDPTVRHTQAFPSKHRAAVSVATTSTTLVGPPTSTAETPTHSSLMSMRHPGDDTAHRPLVASGGIISALGGVPQWGHPPTGAELDAQREGDLARRKAAASAELQPDGQGMKSNHKAFAIKVAPDGTVAIHDKQNWQWQSPFHAEFDVTDAMMRSHGMDPYASYKKKILDDTREQRFEMGAQYKTQQLAMSGRYMEKNVAWLVSRAPTKAELKQGLFELWDDCAETGSDELVAGGTAARAQLMGFIKRTLLEGSPDAFTAEELARFNKQRKSRAPFAPYSG